MEVDVSLAELKENVRASVSRLSPDERHEFVLWAARLEDDYGDVPGEVLDELAAGIWNEDEHHAAPTHPAR